MATQRRKADGILACISERTWLRLNAQYNSRCREPDCNICPSFSVSNRAHSLLICSINRLYLLGPLLTEIFLYLLVAWAVFGNRIVSTPFTNSASMLLRSTSSDISMKRSNEPYSRSRR